MKKYKIMSWLAKLAYYFVFLIICCFLGGNNGVMDKRLTLRLCGCGFKSSLA